MSKSRHLCKYHLDRHFVCQEITHKRAILLIRIQNIPHAYLYVGSGFWVSPVQRVASLKKDGFQFIH